MCVSKGTGRFVPLTQEGSRSIYGRAGEKVTEMLLESPDFGRLQFQALQVFQSGALFLGEVLVALEPQVFAL